MMRCCVGSAPKLTSASICSVMRIEPISAAIPAPARAESISAVNTGASSRASDTPTRPPTETSWRNIFSAASADSAATAPEKKPTSATIGIDSNPTNCSWRASSPP